MKRRDEDGQALPLALGGAFALIATTLALVAIAGAVTGKGRAQRAADLAAISAARSMRDDLSRLLSPPTQPDGSPNPRHLEKVAYLARARAAARDAAAGNGVAEERLRLSFPDGDSFAPLRAKATVVADLELDESRARVEASAVAEAGAPSSGTGGSATTMASGGGYSGPLAHRQGEGMRPDVAAAFDRMAAAASAAGVALVVVSGFRSDAEQAALFAAHPDPRWVAPRASRCTVAPQSSTSVPTLPTVGWRPTQATSASTSATAGRLGTTDSTPARRPARRPATQSVQVGETAPSPVSTACRLSFPRATGCRCCAPRLSGTSPPPCSPRN